jgi:hypothetical protein
MIFNKRQVARRAFDPEHRKLMDAYRTARGGEKLRRLKLLKDYVTNRLKEAGR